MSRIRDVFCPAGWTPRITSQERPLIRREIPTAARAFGVLILALSVGLGLHAQDADESISVEQVGDGRWRAVYRLAAPTASLEFQRPATFYRERVWTVVTPGYAFRREGDMQVLGLADDAEPSREIVVEFGEFTDPLRAEYELFVPFQDGGRALYTGHLYARPDGRDMIRTLSVAPPPDESLVLRGGVHDEPIHWTDAYGDGTYLFFGDADPIETEIGIFVLDRGLPTWIREEFSASLPRLLDLYRERLGAALPWKPLVLYGYEADGTGGFEYAGGTLTGLVQMTAIGEAWREPSAEGSAAALAFLAHELAHLWNGQLTTNGGEHSWTHEGSADAIANRVLLEFGAQGEPAFLAREEAALNACRIRLGGRGVEGANDPRVPYACGQAMALWTEAAIAGADDDADLFGFWRALIAAALPDGGRYDADRYFEIVSSFGVDARTVEAMRRAVDAEAEGTAEAIADGLRRAGVELREGDRPPAPDRGDLAGRAMSHLMGGACDGRYSYNGGDRFRTFAIEGCAPFAEPRTISHIDGLDVATEGDRIYDRVVEACRAGATVVLTAEPADVEVVCDAALAPRPAWVTVEGIP